jgi:hypothetical protein
MSLENVLASVKNWADSESGTEHTVFSFGS